MKDDALKGIAFAFTDRSGNLYDLEAKGWWALDAMVGYSSLNWGEGR